jgi:ribosomal protein S18 acetylase RimI-like enzyme
MIRPMTEADIEAALTLWRGTEGMGLGDADAPERLAGYLQRNPGLSVVAETDGHLVGTALCGHDGRRGYLYHVAVDVGLRRCGLGRALVRACLDGLVREGISRCHLFVFGTNLAGMTFWEHSGWERRGDITLFSRDTTIGALS